MLCGVNRIHIQRQVREGWRKCDSLGAFFFICAAPETGLVGTAGVSQNKTESFLMYFHLYPLHHHHHRPASFSLTSLNLLFHILLLLLLLLLPLLFLSFIWINLHVFILLIFIFLSSLFYLCVLLFFCFIFSLS